MEDEHLTEIEEEVAEDNTVVCLECNDRGWVDIGEHDDLIEVRCPFCNPNLSISEQMDDDS